MKVGRNAPCPCGSGKKYKKCCFLTKGKVKPLVVPSSVAKKLQKHQQDELKREQLYGKIRRGIQTIGIGGIGAINRATRPDYINRVINEAENWKLMPGRIGMTFVAGGFAAFANIVTFRGREQAARDWLTMHLIQEWGVHVMLLDKLLALEKKALQQADSRAEKY